MKGINAREQDNLLLSFHSQGQQMIKASKCVFPFVCAMWIGMLWLVRLVQKQGKWKKEKEGG